MVLLLVFAFLSGLVTILAPCIWPLLPIILSGSIAGKTNNHQRPLGITLGIMLSFAVFTLTISYIVKLLHFDPNNLRLIAVVVISILGISMILPQFSTWIEVLVSRLVGMFGQHQQSGTGFGAGFITGLSLGIVWSPCAGPILAAIATLAATGQVTLTVIAITIAYVLGIGIPLFIFAYAGQQIFTRTRFVSIHLGRIQQVFGIFMLLTALAIYTNYDTYVQAQLLNAFPQITNTLNVFETNDTIRKQLDALKGGNTITTNNNLFNTSTPAPDFVGITRWLNTDKPLTLQDLKGRVVLVDFWTYTCINCIRTLPHVTSWYDKYNKDGFVVIGVHTPEFQFEHETSNVEQAIKLYNIHYPVAQDNDYATWQNYNNEYWPAEYLIDAKGIIRRAHFGEGEYDKMELAIQTLLKESGRTITAHLDTMPDTTPKDRISPETYLNSQRMEFYYPTGNTGNVNKNFTVDNPTLNSFSLGGNWTISSENAVAGENAVLVYNFTADKVFLVLRPPTTGKGTIKVLLDGKVVTSENAGADVQSGIVTVDTDRLYNLIDLKNKPGQHVLRLEFNTQSISAFAFTFG